MLALAAVFGWAPKLAVCIVGLVLDDEATQAEVVDAVAVDDVVTDALVHTGSSFVENTLFSEDDSVFWTLFKKFTVELIS